MISVIQNRDKRRIQLATIIAQPLSKSLHYNEDHLSTLLANSICVVRMSVQTYFGSEDTQRNPILDVSRKTLVTVCKLDIKHTPHELQREFCDLWNKLVNMARTRLTNALTLDPSPRRCSSISASCTSLCMVHLSSIPPVIGSRFQIIHKYVIQSKLNRSNSGLA